MTRIYAEAPFVWQLALRQEHSESCEQLLELASAGTIVLALPLVALIETLSTGRALLAFDRKAISAPITEDLKTADIKVFGTPDQLAPWLASRGVTLTLAAANADRGDTDSRSSS